MLTHELLSYYPINFILYITLQLLHPQVSVSARILLIKSCFSYGFIMNPSIPIAEAIY